MRSSLIPNSTTTLQKKSVAPVAATAPIIKQAPSIQRQACSCGGGCPRCQEDIQLQSKLAVGSTNDPAEKQADQIADQVMQSNSKPVQLEATPSASLQRKTGGEGNEISEAPSIVHDVLKTPGQPLDDATRSFMEPRLNQDLSNVRVHNDADAAASSQAVSANAYTTGNHIVFNQGQYDPHSGSGKKLLAHELAHVVQQSHGGAQQIQRAPVSMYLDPFPDLSNQQLKKLAKTNPEAAEALRMRYKNMPDAELNRLASRGDAMAKSVRDSRIQPNKMVKGMPKKGQGKFSEPGMYDELTDIIENARAESGIKRSGPSAVTPDVEVEGGTMGAAKTNVEGLENENYVGKSPRAGGKVNPQSEFAPATDFELLPQTHGHAEQSLADQLSVALRSVPAENLEGARVWMLIEQMPCSTCASGIADHATAIGVLRKLSEAFPQVTFEIKNQEGSSIITLKGGKEVVKTPTPKTKAPTPSAKTSAKNSKAAPPEPAPKVSEPAPPKANVTETPPKTTTPEVPPETAPPEAVPPKGSSGEWGGAAKTGGMMAVFIAMGYIHSRAVAKRVEQEKEEKGYSGYGPTGNRLYDLGAWFLDPGNDTQRSIGLGQRFDMTKWRAYIRKIAAGKKPGEFMTVHWDTQDGYDIMGDPVIKSFDVKYRKMPDGWWQTYSGDTDDPPDINKVIDEKYSDEEVRKYLQLPSAADLSGLA
jgi:hypothetical protein